jgi:restriction system protein
MSLPEAREILTPLLKLFQKGVVYQKIIVINRLADELHLSEAERTQKLPNRDRTIFRHLVSALIRNLCAQGLLEKPSKGKYRITDKGHYSAWAISQDGLDEFLRDDSGAFVRATKYAIGADATPSIQAVESLQSEIRLPENIIESNHLQLRQDLARDILEIVKSCSPRFFERLVVDLLLKMGYGGSLQDAGKVIGRSGDGGIDGLIKEDKLGLDVIYMQAKRWEGSVGRPAVQAFAGSLEGQRAMKGVLITTSTFTNDAREFVKHIEKKIVLIDGYELAQLMIEHDVGVTTAATYAIKKMDTDYFEEE